MTKEKRPPKPGETGKGYYPCPCCKYFVLDRPSYFRICIICGWEDDGVDGDPSGPNTHPIEVYRAMFERGEINIEGLTVKPWPELRRGK